MVTPRRILVRLPNWVGDVVMATPALRALRVHWPAAHITALVRDYASGLLRGHPSVDEVWSLSESEERGLWPAWRLGGRIRAGDFDLAVLFTNSWTSAWPVWLGRARLRVGYRGDLRSILLNAPVDPQNKRVRREPTPMPRLYQRLLDRVEVPAAGPRYELVAGEESRARVRLKLERLGAAPGARLVGLNPGAKFGASKLWPTEEFGRLAVLLTEAGWTPIVLGSPSEVPLMQAVVAASGGVCLDTSGDPFALEELPALCLDLSAFVTTDSGPRHVANWAGLPSVVLMGPTHPGWTEWNMEKTTVLRREVDCGPCHQRVCPLDHRCLVSIPASEAFSALMTLISRAGATARDARV